MKYTKLLKIWKEAISYKREEQIILWKYITPSRKLSQNGSLTLEYSLTALSFTTVSIYNVSAEGWGWGRGQGEEMNHQRCFDFMTKVQLEAYLPDSPYYTIWEYTSSYNFLLFFIPVKQMQLQGEKEL